MKFGGYRRRLATGGPAAPLSLGFVTVIGVLLIEPVSSWAAPFGARLAHRLPKRKLEIGFAVFLLLVASRFAASLIVAI